MISIALQREVPQYMAIPWFITKVIARTISADTLDQLNIYVYIRYIYTHIYFMMSVAGRELSHQPSIGLLTSFLLAKTMSTYSSWSLDNDPLRPAGLKSGLFFT